MFTTLVKKKKKMFTTYDKIFFCICPNHINLVSINRSSKVINFDTMY